MSSQAAPGLFRGCRFLLPLPSEHAITNCSAAWARSLKPMTPPSSSNPHGGCAAGRFAALSGGLFLPVRVAVPCFCSAGRGPLAKNRPRSSCAWPIFASHRGGCLQKPERCAKHSSLFRPQDAVAVFAPAPPRLFLPQAAARLRSHPPSSGSPGPAGPILLRLANFPGGRREGLDQK